MASGTILLTPSATSGSYVAGKLVWSSTADAAGNCSQLTAELYARKDSTTTILTIPTYGTWNFSLTVAGQTVTGSPVLSILTDWVLVGSLQRTVAHSASGSGSAAISCWVSGPAGTSLAGHRASGSGTAVLDSIPRISQPSLGSASFRLGDPVVIYTNPCSGEFTHTLRYTFGSRSGLIGEKVASQFSWNAPAALAEEIPGARTGTGYIHCDTYRGSEKLGTARTPFTVELYYPTKPQISVSRTAVGTQVQVNLPRQASVYTHTVSWYFGGDSGVLAQNAGTQVPLTIPLNWAAKIPDQKEAQARITSVTWNGAVRIGEAETLLWVTVPDTEEMKPEFTAALTPGGTVPEMFSGMYIQGKTPVRADFEAVSAYSRVAGCSLTVDGKTHTGDPAVSVPLQTPGDRTVRLRVTDGRGYWREKTQTIFVHAYTTPRILPPAGYPEVICSRCREDGTLDPGGTWLRLRAGIGISPVDGCNQGKLELRHRTSQGGWSDALVLSEDGEVDRILPEIVSSSTLSYEIRLELTDSMGESSYMTFRIPTARAALHLRPGGTGAAFGKYAELDRTLELDPDWDLKLRDRVLRDFVVEYGMSGIWKYRKWYSGWAECWGEATVSADITSPWGSLYRGSISGKALPFAFAEPPHWQVWADGNGVLPLSGGSAAKDQLPAVYLVSPTSGQAVGCRVCWYAAGELETQGGELV